MSRNKKFIFYLSQSEHSELKKLAKEKNMTMSSFVRERIFSKEGKVREFPKEY
tara:strand:+ start:5255 stop:5413 length:159 start_codon:yes stop_codon:yes gene_type:complete